MDVRMQNGHRSPFRRSRALYAAGIWLVSVGTAVSFAGAIVGAVLVRALTDLSPLLAILIGGAAGWVLFSLVLGGAAERLDRRLHRM
jgi:hypothetical protein